MSLLRFFFTNYICAITIAIVALYFQRNLSNNLDDDWGRFVKYIASQKRPKFLITLIIAIYSEFFRVVKSDLIKPLSEYQTIQEFFIREVKPRQIEKNDRAILAPADSKLLSISKITTDNVMKIKDKYYSLGEFLTNNNGYYFSEKEVQELKRNPENQLYSLIFYLSPGDYHRFHAPMDMQIQEYRPFKGFKKRVDPKTLEKEAVSLIESFGAK